MVSVVDAQVEPEEGHLRAQHVRLPILGGGGDDDPLRDVRRRARRCCVEHLDPRPCLGPQLLDHLPPAADDGTRPRRGAQQPIHNLRPRRRNPARAARGEAVRGCGGRHCRRGGSRGWGDGRDDARRGRRRGRLLASLVGFGEAPRPARAVEFAQELRLHGLLAAQVPEAGVVKVEDRVCGGYLPAALVVRRHELAALDDAAMTRPLWLDAEERIGGA
mmetsp:Transcript_24486/g.79929  ORF Transcript_24486/g.79929 Transcript_24486/m.79929 type:complete len:218 (-) Transcript_24486:1097-1750(-)